MCAHLVCERSDVVWEQHMLDTVSRLRGWFYFKGRSSVYIRDRVVIFPLARSWCNTADAQGLWGTSSALTSSFSIIGLLQILQFLLLGKHLKVRCCLFLAEKKADASFTWIFWLYCCSFLSRVQDQVTLEMYRWLKFPIRDILRPFPHMIRLISPNPSLISSFLMLLYFSHKSYILGWKHSMSNSATVR